MKEYDVVIVGAGPSGLSASLYTQRAGLSTVVLTGDMLGGLVSTTEQVDNYLGLPGMSGDDMSEVFTEHAIGAGVELVYESAVNVHKRGDGFVVHVDSDEKYYGRAVIFATGSTPKKLGVDFESLTLGISYCATCDGFFFEGKDVAVVGGGETAVEDALYLSRLARHVTVIVRSDFRAVDTAVLKLESQPNVTVIRGDNVESLLVDDGRLTGIRLLKYKAEVKVSGLFIAIGQSPNSKPVEGNVDYDNQGYISNPVSGLFIAGDVGEPEYRQIAVAVGTGAKAGMDAVKYLS